jgi:hypothetical protein
MPYIQKNNPIPKTGCGRRRMEQMTNPFKKETKMEVNPNASKVNKPETYAVAVDPKAKEYSEASIIKRAFMTNPNVKNLSVPFGGGKIGRLYKAGKKMYDKATSPKKKISKASLNKVSAQLKKASKLHAGQAAKIDKATSAMKKEVPSQRIKSRLRSQTVGALKPRKTIVGPNYKPKKFSVKGKAAAPMKKISGPCKAAAKRKFKVWPSAYASGWGVRCTKAGGPSKFGG